ncbi:MAG: D-aminoacyl-tRNA deacylase [Luminiphilus sp.]|nr:D-aminoacyl-tRNA deacylase [Luminiphilus sp.]MDG1461418.1 D-aminoacyl-tRNA deacylase [Luminiphilus sp.]
MKCLVQRVTEAAVEVAGERIGAIGSGLLVLVGVEKKDDNKNIERMVERLLGYRLFGDNEDRMNRSIRDVSGDLLLVSQFTLAADTKKGARPSFSSAAEPAIARTFFDEFVELIRAQHAGHIATGRFGANMQVSLINDGPVTFLLET